MPALIPAGNGALTQASRSTRRFSIVGHEAVFTIRAFRHASNVGVFLYDSKDSKLLVGALLYKVPDLTWNAKQLWLPVIDSWKTGIEETAMLYVGAALWTWKVLQGYVASVVHERRNLARLAVAEASTWLKPIRISITAGNNRVEPGPQILDVFAVTPIDWATLAKSVRSYLTL